MTTTLLPPNNKLALVEVICFLNYTKLIFLTSSALGELSGLMLKTSKINYRKHTVLKVSVKAGQL